MSSQYEPRKVLLSGKLLGSGGSGENARRFRESACIQKHLNRVCLNHKCFLEIPVIEGQDLETMRCPVCGGLTEFKFLYSSDELEKHRNRRCLKIWIPGGTQITTNVEADKEVGDSNVFHTIDSHLLSSTDDPIDMIVPNWEISNTSEYFCFTGGMRAGVRTTSLYGVQAALKDGGRDISGFIRLRDIPGFD